MQAHTRPPEALGVATGSFSGRFLLLGCCFVPFSAEDGSGWGSEPGMPGPVVG